MTSKDTSTLLVDNVSVQYGDFLAIEDIELELKPGEFWGLIGLNGAGKTTLIKTILNLRPADKGEILLFGERNDSAAAKQRLSFLPERFEPCWFMTGIEFLRFATALYKKNPRYEAVSDDMFREKAESLALDPNALDRLVQTYSKGMRQKLGLLSSLLTPCDLIILDEPMSGLDPRARSHVKDTLMAMKKENKTFLISSHILADMDEICDKITVLEKKRLQFTGTPKGLKEAAGEKKLERAFLQFIENKIAA